MAAPELSAAQAFRLKLMKGRPSFTETKITSNVRRKPASPRKHSPAPVQAAVPVPPETTYKFFLKGESFGARFAHEGTNLVVRETRLVNRGEVDPDLSVPTERSELHKGDIITAVKIGTMFDEGSFQTFKTSQLLLASIRDLKKRGNITLKVEAGSLRRRLARFARES